MNDADREIQLRPWLYRIAAQRVAERPAGRARDDRTELERADTLVVEDVVVRRQQLRETLAAIEALPAPQRDALLLREIEGRSHDEIAAALGVSVGGARQHLYRARASVRAAVTAITPYPLLVRLMEMATSSGAGESTMARAGEVAVGTGLGAVATKVGVGALAAGALVGGAIHADRITHPTTTTAAHGDGAHRAPRRGEARRAWSPPRGTSSLVAVVGFSVRDARRRRRSRPRDRDPPPPPRVGLGLERLRFSLERVGLRRPRLRRVTRPGSR